jgi:hypothetical protein
MRRWRQMTLARACLYLMLILPGISAAEPTDDSAADAAPPESAEIRTTGVPAGFERFLEPQLTAVDLYFGGKLVVTTLAEYTPERITLLDPDKVAASIPQLAEPQQLIAFLSQPLPSNADRVCTRPGQPLCGRLSPDIAGVIFNENRFRADLFINPDLLRDARPDDDLYLPPPDREAVTVVQNLSALATGNNNADDQFSLYGMTRAGYHGHYGFADWISTDEQGISFDQAGYTHLLRDHEVTAGLFEPDTSALRSLRRDLIAGGRVAVSLNRRQDTDSIISTPIDIFLPVRGRVDIFRDGRLLSSGFYEAGNQLIDSNRLPNGSYLIDIVITDDSGNSRTEQQLFVKSSLLPPPGRPKWFIEAGQVRLRTADEVMPDDADTSILRSGYRWRQNDILSWGLASAVTDDQALAELSGNFFTDWSELGGEVFTSSEGGSGWGMRGSARWWKTIFSVTTQRNNADDQDFLDEAPYPLLPTDRWLHSLQASRPVFNNGLLSINHSYSGSEPGESSHRTAMRYVHTQNLGNGKALTYTGELARIDGDNRFQLSVQWRATSYHWNHSAQADWTSSDLDETEGVAATAGTRWYDREVLADDLQVGANARFDKDSRSLNLDADHRSQYGRGRAAVTVANSDDQDTRQYLVGYDTSIVLDERQRLSMGGQQPADSAVVLNLEGAEDVMFDVAVDGQRQFTARGGGRVPVTLPAYDQYVLSINDRGTTMASFDGEPRSTTLYVGDVDTLDYEVQHINVLVSRLFAVNRVCSDVTNECYEIPLPMASTLVRGVKGVVFTDSEGYFQAEVASTQQTLEAEFDGLPCTIDLSQLTAQNGILRASRLYCETADAGSEEQVDETEATPVNDSALPAEDPAGDIPAAEEDGDGATDSDPTAD